MHKEFCLNDDVTKSIPENNKWNCNNSKLKIGDNIVLKGGVRVKRD